MKIGSPIESRTVTEPTARTGRATTSAVAPAAGGERVAVSAAGAQMSATGSAEFDGAKVDAIRQAIQEGRFTVNSGAIADRLIADAAALLAPRAGK